MKWLDRIDNRINLLSESTAEDIKDVNSPGYIRKAAEDLLYNTIGPLTDMPRFSNEWNAMHKTPQPEGFTPGGPAPKWSETEIVMAMAGDPSLLGSPATGSPKHPLGSPIYRAAAAAARTTKRYDLLDDGYALGLIALAKKMQSGQDASIAGFISFVMPAIKAGIQNGSGSTLSLDMLLGTKGVQYIGPGNEIKRVPPKKDAKLYKKVDLYGIQAIENPKSVKGGLNLSTPSGLRQAASVVTGKYREADSNDTHPGNPFNPLSATYYKTVMALADAIESGDKGKIQQAMIGIDQLKEMAMERTTSTLGFSTGLGQAVTNKDRSVANTVHSIRFSVGREDLADALEAATKGGGSMVDKDDDSFIVSFAGSLNQANNYIKSLERFGFGQIIRTERRGGVVSADTSEDEEGGTLGGTLAAREESDEVERSEIINKMLNKALTYDPLALISKTPKFKERVIQKLSEINQYLSRNDVDLEELKGPLTAIQYRYLLRALGPVASNYPGKGVVREKVDVKRGDANRNWWRSGEDPELEPFKEGTWESIWLREGMPMMSVTEISAELAKEPVELTELGIQHAMSPKVSKQAISATLAKAMGKYLILRIIFAEDLGLDESKQYDRLDKMIMREGIDFIINRLRKTLIEHQLRTFKV